MEHGLLPERMVQDTGSGIPIVAEVWDDPCYPAIQVLVGGQVAAIVEWCEYKQTFQIHSYDGIQEDPASSITYSPPNPEV